MTHICPRCKGPVDVKSRHLAVTGSTIQVFCSADCRAGIDDPPVAAEVPARRTGWLVLGGLAVGSLAIVWWHATRPAPSPPPSHAGSWLPLPPPPPAPKVVGPSPAELAQRAQRAEDEALLADLMHDTWIHPLAGPRRRMPINHTAAFGAEREGERPPECVSGHCGVDIGGSIWGEPVHCAHDGVIDWVNRGPNEEHGGIFVKVAHRDGSLYTWYFHLAAVPRWIHPGVKVKAGDVIGLVGDTGVKNSGPHLHFSISVKTKQRERYLDPEPMIAIWPLWIPDEDGRGHVSTQGAPGVPVREAPKPKPPAPADDAGSAT